MRDRDAQADRPCCRECKATYLFPSAANPNLCGLCAGAYEREHEWGRLD